MMHNSLLISDRLEKANNDEISRSRRDPHRDIRKMNNNSKEIIGEQVIRLTDEWSVNIEAEFEGMEEAAADLTGYLQLIGVTIVPNSTQAFVLHKDSDIENGAFKREVREGRVILSASDTLGIWAGIVYLEKEISAQGTLSIPLGTIARLPNWKVQIGQAPYGTNYLVPDLNETYLSDDAFRLMIHYGINGMTLYGDWLFYVKSDRFPELNHPDYDKNIAILKDTAMRAKKYGISLYYVPVSPKLDGNHPLFRTYPSVRGARIFPGLKETDKKIYNLCSSDPLSLAFQGETMAGLFREVPELGGLILIIGGESYYHCFMRPDRRGLEQGVRTNCKSCQGGSAEEAVNALLKATADAVHEVKQGVPIMAWPYSAFIWSGDPAQTELLQQMSPGVSLLNTIEKDELVKKDGYSKRIWDYSIDFTGPAANLVKQAAIAEERNIDLYVKTETALGLECIHIPYMPSLNRLAEKWDNVAAMRPTGVLQSWMFFGMWGSRAEELGWWSNWRPEVSKQEAIRIMAQRDFGENAPAYIRAWSQISEAVSHYPYIPQYFTGPEFIGPAHPLVFGKEPENKEQYEALLYYLQENEETFSTVVNEVKHSLVLSELPYSHMNGTMKADTEIEFIDIFISEYALACDYAHQAYEEVNKLPISTDVNVAAIEAEERLLIEFVYRTFQTTINSYRFLLAKEQGKAEVMKQIAVLELQNTREAVPLLKLAPWLDLSRRNDGEYPSSIVMMETKIKSLEREVGHLA